MSSLLTDDDSDGLSLGLRLMLFPALAGILFIGGVYWLHLQFDAARGRPEPSAVVQVQLLPRPEPAPIPVSALAPLAGDVMPSPATAHAEAPANRPSDVVAALPSEHPAPIEPAPAHPSLPSATDAVPNPAMMEFRNALLRHIARYQTYPKAAERQRLQGTARVVFAIGRDGKLLGAWIKTSSGQSLLDQAAIDTIRRAQPLPAIPTALPESLKVEAALGFDPP